MQAIYALSGLTASYLIYLKWGRQWLKQFRDLYRLYVLYKAAGGDLSTAGIDKYPGFVVIKYQDAGQTYKVCLPYDPQRVSRMCGIKAELKVNGELIDITQQPGIPYSISGNNLTGTIVIQKSIFGQKEYTDMAPMYASEMDYDE